MQTSCWTLVKVFHKYAVSTLKGSANLDRSTPFSTIFFTLRFIYVFRYFLSYKTIFSVNFRVTEEKSFFIVLGLPFWTSWRNSSRSMIR